jgi:hypothetical protein
VEGNHRIQLEFSPKTAECKPISASFSRKCPLAPIPLEKTKLPRCHARCGLQSTDKQSFSSAFDPRRKRRFSRAGADSKKHRYLGCETVKPAQPKQNKQVNLAVSTETPRL